MQTEVQTAANMSTKTEMCAAAGAALFPVLDSPAASAAVELNTNICVFCGFLLP